MKKLLILLIGIGFIIGCNSNEDKPLVPTITTGSNSEQSEHIEPKKIPSRFELLEHRVLRDENGNRIIETYIFKADDHEYVMASVWSSDAGGGLLHSESCPCKKPVEIDHLFKEI